MTSINDEVKNLIRSLKPKVTAFTVQIHNNGEHGEEVTCGGKVIRFIDSQSWVDEDNRIVYATIDDALGEILIVVPHVLWQTNQIQTGDVVVVKGVLFSLLKECEFISKAKTPITITRKDEPLRVLVREIEKIKFANKI